MTKTREGLCKRGKTQDYSTHEYRGKKPKQNISKPNTATCKKVNPS